MPINERNREKIGDIVDWEWGWRWIYDHKLKATKEK